VFHWCSTVSEYVRLNPFLLEEEVVDHDQVLCSARRCTPAQVR
jgi:hypothetical protein